MSKRIELQTAPLVLTLERVAAETDNSYSDYVELTVTRGELRILSAEIDRDEILDGGTRYNTELTPSELNQIDAALIAEWLDWKPSDIGESMASETILDVFARLKKSLEDKGLVVAGGEAAE